MRKLISSLVLICSVVATPLLLAQEKEPNKLIQFQMALLRKGPKWNEITPSDRRTILQQHFGNVLAMMEAGEMVIAGPLRDQNDLSGIFILRTASAEEATNWVNTDPAVKAGLMAFELHPWWSQDVLKKPNRPLKMNTINFNVVYLGFLRKGPNRKDGDSDNPEVKGLQKA